jgi:hypothetical protein
MANNMQEALAKLLDGYDARRRADLERERRAKEEAELFLEQFAELRRSVIRPVFEAAGAILEAHGHRFSITEQEFASGSEGRSSEAGISLRLVAAGTKAPLHEDQHSLAITTRHYNRTVWVNSGDAPNAGGIAGAKGAYTLDKLTREIVENELLAFVARFVAV